MANGPAPMGRLRNGRSVMGRFWLLTWTTKRSRLSHSTPSSQRYASFAAKAAGRWRYPHIRVPRLAPAEPEARAIYQGNQSSLRPLLPPPAGPTGPALLTFHPSAIADPPLARTLAAGSWSSPSGAIWNYDGGRSCRERPGVRPHRNQARAVGIYRKLLWSGHSAFRLRRMPGEDMAMNGVIYLVGLIVIILAILSFLGLR